MTVTEFQHNHNTCQQELAGKHPNNDATAKQSKAQTRIDHIYVYIHIYVSINVSISISIYIYAKIFMYQLLSASTCKHPNITHPIHIHDSNKNFNI